MNTDSHDNEKHIVHVEPEFRLILVDPGPERAKVTILVRQHLSVSPAEALRRVEQGEVVVADGLSHWEVTQLKTEFENLGAAVCVT